MNNKLFVLTVYDNNENTLVGGVYSNMEDLKSGVDKYIQWIKDNPVKKTLFMLDQIETMYYQEIDLNKEYFSNKEKNMEQCWSNFGQGISETGDRNNISHYMRDEVIGENLIGKSFDEIYRKIV